MKRTNEMIFAAAMKYGFMTEKDMQLLKNRSNLEQKDLYNYDLDRDGYGIRIDAEWALKGLEWLRSLLKKNGEPKAGQSLGYREIEIIRNLKPEDFSFKGFYDAGNGWHRCFVPLYDAGWMEYYVWGGQIQVVG